MTVATKLGATKWARIYESATSALRRQDTAAAMALFNRCLHLNPEASPALDALGAIHFDKAQFRLAMPCLRRAATLQPDAPHLFNLGVIYKSLHRYEQALSLLKRSADQSPDAETFFKIGRTLMYMLRYEEAVPYSEKALELEPTHREAAFDISYCNLGYGNFRQGWRTYERRTMIPWLMKKEFFSGDRWDGKPISGSLLVGFEQGLGDLVLFIRYAHLARKLCDRLVVQAPDAIRDLILTAPGVDAIVPAGVRPAGYAYHIPFASLPLVLGVDPVSTPTKFPYFDLPTDKLRRAADWLSTLPGPGPRIGIVWSGNPHFIRDKQRSIPFQQFLSLLEVPNATFVSLQHGERADDLSRSSVSGLIVDARERTPTFVDTATLIANLDLLICCDTSVANIAGALGKPVWVLTERLHEWRWYIDANGKPAWYPSARIFPQQIAGNWSKVMALVGAALKEKMRH